MNPPTYAGIGARATPKSVLNDMTAIAAWLARTGWHLASGGARGADSAFAAGASAGRRTVHLPWAGYNGHGGPDCRVPSPSKLAAWMDIAARLHPAWHRCSPAVRKLHARNAAILLGTALDQPVDAVVAWTPGGAVTGGTGMALRIAASRCSTWASSPRARPASACGPSATGPDPLPYRVGALRPTGRTPGGREGGGLPRAGRLPGDTACTSTNPTPIPSSPPRANC